MKGKYPRFKTTYVHDELVEHFLLNPAERTLVETCREDANRHGVAVLLKAVQYLGYFPHDLQQVPEAVRTFIAHQLQLLWDHTPEYPWHSRSHDNHVGYIFYLRSVWRCESVAILALREQWNSMPCSG